MTDGSDALFDDAAVPGPGTCLSAQGPYGAFPEALPHAGEELQRTCESSDAGEEQVAEISPLAVLDPAKLRRVQAQRLSGCDALGAPPPPPPVPVPFALEPGPLRHDGGHDVLFPPPPPFCDSHNNGGDAHDHGVGEDEDSGDESDSEESNSSSRTSCDAVEMEMLHAQQQQQQQQQQQEHEEGLGPARQAPLYALPVPAPPVAGDGVPFGALPKLMLCLRCLTRLEDMERSPGFGCKKGARLFKQNWVVSHKKCFGACQCDDFCVSHGYPVDQCLWMHRGATHKVTRYFGQWGDASTKNANPRMHNGNLAPPAWGADTDPLAPPPPPPQPQPQPQPPLPAPAVFPGPPSQKRSRSSAATVASDATATTAAAAPAASASSSTSPSPPPPLAPLVAAPLVAAPLVAAPVAAPVPAPVRQGRTGARVATQHRLEGQSAYLVPCAGRPAIEHSPTFPCDCCTRLSRLLAVHWIENSLDLVAALRARVEASKTRCLGFCQSCYLCRLHCAPAIINEGRHPSRYQCLVDDHESTPKGRHHADFLFYCARPACCNGKWFARDETHARTLRKRGITHADAVRPLTAAEERLFAETRCPAPVLQLAPPPAAPPPADDDAAAAVVPAPSAPSIETVLGASTATSTTCSTYNNNNSSSSVTVPYDRLLGAGRGGGENKLEGKQGVGGSGGRRTAALAACTCRARAAVVLAVCVVAAAVVGAVLATRRSASALAATELQMCWSLAWSDAGARVSTQGCRLCARNGTAYLCRSDAAPRMLVLEAALSANRCFLQHVRLRATHADTLETANAILPWTFSSAATATAGALAQPRDSDPTAANSTAGNSTGMLPDVWYGFILAVGT